MQIGILGAKLIGSTLARKWVAVGHQVKFGVRNSGHSDVQALLAELGPLASAGTPAEAIAFGEVVVFAIPGHAMDETIATHAAALADKIVIDAANRMGTSVMNSAETFARLAPSAKVFRAFNNLGWENFAQPVFDGWQADLLYCGADGDAQLKVEQLIADVELRPVRVGGLAQIQLVDAVGGLWFALALGQGLGRHLAFKVLV
jgi:predicted dinucleotide-binding enzyme